MVSGALWHQVSNKNNSEAKHATAVCDVCVTVGAMRNVNNVKKNMFFGRMPVPDASESRVVKGMNERCRQVSSCLTLLVTSDGAFDGVVALPSHRPTDSMISNLLDFLGLSRPLSNDAKAELKDSRLDDFFP